MTADARLTAGQAARAAGVSRKAMRIYEEKGLVVPVDRTPAGYRLFGTNEVGTLRFIRRARALGLGLGHIADILGQHRAGGPVCPTVETLLEERVRQIDRAIGELQALRRILISAVEECDENPSDHTVCPLIERDRTPEVASHEAL